ncbi:unnamed protein product, partial [Ectocarpus sp. 6 AP-2014]
MNFVARVGRARSHQAFFGTQPRLPSGCGNSPAIAASAARTTSAAVAIGRRSLARSPTILLGRSGVKQSCSSWARSRAPSPRGFAKAGRLPPSLQRGSRIVPPCASWANKGGRCVGAGNRALSSFLPRGGRYSDSMVIYGVVGLNVAGTVAMYLYESQGTGGPFLFGNFMVSTYTTLMQGRLHTLFTSNFSHSNLWNGAIFSYMMYTLGPTAIQHLGRRQFLALYLLGGAFSQLCQVAGPGIASRLGLPSVLQVDPYYFSSGARGDARRPGMVLRELPQQPNHSAGGACADGRCRSALPGGYAVSGGIERGGGTIPWGTHAGDLENTGSGRSGSDGGISVAGAGRRAIQVHPEI